MASHGSPSIRFASIEMGLSADEKIFSPMDVQEREKIFDLLLCFIQEEDNEHVVRYIYTLPHYIIACAAHSCQLTWDCSDLRIMLYISIGRTPSS